MQKQRSRNNGGNGNSRENDDVPVEKPDVKEVLKKANKLQHSQERAVKIVPRRDSCGC